MVGSMKNVCLITAKYLGAILLLVLISVAGAFGIVATKYLLMGVCWSVYQVGYWSLLPISIFSLALWMTQFRHWLLTAIQSFLWPVGVGTMLFCFALLLVNISSRWLEPAAVQAYEQQALSLRFSLRTLAGFDLALLVLLLAAICLVNARWAAKLAKPLLVWQGAVGKLLLVLTAATTFALLTDTTLEAHARQFDLEIHRQYIGALRDLEQEKTRLEAATRLEEPISHVEEDEWRTIGAAISKLDSAFMFDPLHESALRLRLLGRQTIPAPSSSPKAIDIPFQPSMSNAQIDRKLTQIQTIREETDRVEEDLSAVKKELVTKVVAKLLAFAAGFSFGEIRDTASTMFGYLLHPRDALASKKAAIEPLASAFVDGMIDSAAQKAAGSIVVDGEGALTSLEPISIVPPDNQIVEGITQDSHQRIRNYQAHQWRVGTESKGKGISEYSRTKMYSRGRSLPRP